MAERAFVTSMRAMGANSVRIGDIYVDFTPSLSQQLPYSMGPLREAKEEYDSSVEVHEPEISDAPEDEAFDRWFNHTPIPVKG